MKCQSQFSIRKVRKNIVKCRLLKFYHRRSALKLILVASHKRRPYFYNTHTKNGIWQNIRYSLSWIVYRRKRPITKTCLFKNTENFTTKKWKFSDKKKKKKSGTFHISAQNIDCGYSLEPPRRGGSSEYPQSMFLSRNKKNNVYSCKPQFYYIKNGGLVGQNYIGMFSWCIGEGGGRVVRRCCVSYITGASNWYWLTVGQGLLSL